VICCLPVIDLCLPLAAAWARAADINQQPPVPELGLRPASML